MAVHVVPLVVYCSTVFATGLIVLLVCHLIVHVLPDVRVPPPFGDNTLTTSIVNGLSEVSSVIIAPPALYPITFTRQSFSFCDTVGTVQLMQFKPVTLFIRFQFVPLSIEYFKSNFRIEEGACQHIAYAPPEGKTSPPLGTVTVMRSHTSPIPSPSLSRWSGFAMVGQLSLQSFIPSLSVSVSGLPHPHMPGCVLFGSFGHPSLQSAVPSPSESVSAIPQPHMPGATLLGSLGQPSLQFGVPSP